MTKEEYCPSAPSFLSCL